MNIILLTEKINEICPIYGLDTNRNISFKDKVTEEQKSLAYEIYDSWVDPPEPDVTGFVMALANSQTLNNWYENLPKIVTDMMASYMKDRDFKALNSLVLGLNLTEEIKTELNILISQYDIPLVI
jgi:hypothetical protein